MRRGREKSGPTSRISRKAAAFLVVGLLLSLSFLSLAAGPSSPRPSGSVTIEEYYRQAHEAGGFDLPEGLRSASWHVSSPRGKDAPVITSPCLHYDPGEFERLFFDSPQKRRVREIFVENEVDVDRLGRLLKTHASRNQETVCIFDEGYLLLTDRQEKMNYILPIGKGLGRRLASLTE